jgi:lipopolysaccharide/colanic/teichoic acid biosynthesis glycosyltransferase
MGLLLLLPVFIPIIILLKFTAEGEVFYKQERIGSIGNPFYILKFATMLKESSKMGHGNLTVRNDPRITFLGGFLRKSKINELPQLWNVLVGEMSFIGPRPMLSKGISMYTEEVRIKILSTKPGITGIGSLVFRDEEKLVTIYNEKGYNTKEYYQLYIFPFKGELESWYIARQSFGLDFKILFATFWSIVTNKINFIFQLFPSLPNRPEILTQNYLSKLNKT